MTTLSEYVETQSRFARSANVERDSGAAGVKGYLPTGRAMDVISRVARGLNDASAGRTFSITGPHGGGKSSLAVFLSALLSPIKSAEARASLVILRQADMAVADDLASGIASVGGAPSGFITAAATARSEPVSATIGRALHAGAVKALGPKQIIVPSEFADSHVSQPPSEQSIREVVQRLCAISPMILIIDEFGKNLEAYANSKGAGDPYLLQELAESTQGTEALPLVVITMQHLAFDEYVQETSASRRREWAKVQGRFQDVPYVETPEQSQRLIVESLRHKDSKFAASARRWAKANGPSLSALNLGELAPYVSQAFPLHPVTMAVLPDLCSRFGQNERTLFSFIAGSEPLSVPAFLASAEWAPNQPVPMVGLDRVYDFFIESVTSMIGVAESASRWVEIETRIRDSAGLSSLELGVAKTIGVLNLVSSGGKIRASRDMLEFALRSDPSVSSAEIDAAITALEERGVLVYRTFSDEYRLWQGSDYDIKRAVETSRRRIAETPLADLLNTAAQLQPVVAGRHSQRTGVLRIFGQRFSDLSTPQSLDDQWDGLLVLATVSDGDLDEVSHAGDERPIIVVEPADLSSLRDAAIEAAALRLALDAAEAEGVDWVARRELAERTAGAQQHLGKLVEGSWNHDSTWTLVGSSRRLDPDAGASRVLSDVCDITYAETPRIANEMIGRRDLTSQGAKARRMLIDAMLEQPEHEQFGISGYGPERAMYEAIFRSTGIHRPDPSGTWVIDAPTDKRWKAVWTELSAGFDAADSSRVGLVDIMRALKLPPFGLKDGVLPLVVIAALVSRADDIAVYEHGSLVLGLDDAVCERLAKNPANFSVRNSAANSPARTKVVMAIADRMQIGTTQKAPTFLNVTTALFRELRLLTPFAQKTKDSLSREALSVREAFLTAMEPDVLLFETLPAIFGIHAFKARGPADADAAATFARALAAAIAELRAAYPSLLDSVAANLAEATSLSGSANELQQRLNGRATELEGRLLEPRLRSFVGALARQREDYRQWLENVAMVVAEGQAPRVWTDDVASRFPLRVAELGGAMRRTEALLYDRMAEAAESNEFAAHRVAITRADGTEWNQVLSISTSEQQEVSRDIDILLEQMTRRWGSRATARRMVMAQLANEEFEGVGTQLETKSSDKERNHG